MPYDRSIDIDDKLDFKIVEKFLKNKKMIYKKIANNISNCIKKISTSKKLILHSPYLKKDDVENVSKCLKSSYISTVSNYTNLFEKNKTLY